MLAIMWTNQLDALSNKFDDIYGSNAAIAKQLVNRAIDDWEAVITNFNFPEDSDSDPNNNLNNTFKLSIIAGEPGEIPGRGRTTGITLSNGRPTSATIIMDDNGQGTGWFFDQTPLDDAEFTAIVNSGANGTEPAFQASFIDSNTGGSNYNDFYRTIVHEIGHALGIFQGGLLTSLVTFVGIDQVEPVRQNPNGTFVFNDLWQFNGSSGVSVTFTEAGGLHIYEGPVDPNYPSAPIHPNDLLNAGRTVPVGQNPIETTRQIISDLDVQVLADIYGYSVVLPSTLDTMHATLDSQTGTLLIQSGVNLAGDARNESIHVELADPNTIRVRVVGPATTSTELFDRAGVRQIVIAQNGGADGVHVAAELDIPGFRQDVQYVVSSNQDSNNAGTLGDDFVDQDTAVPGRQISLRSAIVDARGTAPGSFRAVYMPRGKYNLNIAGSGGDTQGDIDIDRNMIVIGAGAGSTIIDGSALFYDPNPSAPIRDRIFETLGTGSLDLWRMSLTGGQTPFDGGAIRVNVNTEPGFGTSKELSLFDVAVVGNTATAAAGNGSGGGIFLEGGADAEIYGSVIAENTAETFDSADGGGGIYASGFSTIGATVYLERTIIGNNTLSGPGVGVDLLSYPIAEYISGGSNMIGSTSGASFGTTGLQVNDYTDQTSGFVASDYVVTSIVDASNSVDDNYSRSIRDAIAAADAASGAQVMWLPAWHFMMTLVGGGGVAEGDFEITTDVTMRGVGPGLTMIDASRINDRHFDIVGGATLGVSQLTLAYGAAPTTGVERNGGAIRVNDGGHVDLSFSAIVGNMSQRSGDGGGIYFAALGSGSIENSVITVNESEDNTGGVYLAPSSGTGGMVSVKNSIIAKNIDDGSGSQDVFAGTNRTFTSGGNNRIGNETSGLADNPTGNGDIVGTPHYIVTTIVDTFDGSTDPVDMSIRDAIHRANESVDTPEEIWLPAWDFVLTRDRDAYGPDPMIDPTDVDVAFGDLDIKDSLTIGGTGPPGATTVGWKPGISDAVFDLLGDYDGDGITSSDNGIVGSEDYSIWRDWLGSTTDLRADDDDDGVVDQDDYDIWLMYHGNTLTLDNDVEIG